MFVCTVTARGPVASILSGCLVLSVSACFVDSGGATTGSSSQTDGDGSGGATTNGSSSGATRFGGSEFTTSGTGQGGASTSGLTGPVPTTVGETEDVPCAYPLGDCGEVPDGVCETDLAIDPQHCGACFSPCADVCVDGECVPGKLIFVTSGGFKGKLGGLDGADAKCDEFAFEAGHEGYFLAWISAGNLTPATRFSKSDSPYVRPDGELVATDWEDLTDGSLNRPINVDESGEANVNPQTCGTTIWNNTNYDGTLADVEDCVGWSADAGLGANSDNNLLDERWSDPSYCDPAECDTPKAIICVEQ